MSLGFRIFGCIALSVTYFLGSSFSVASAFAAEECSREWAGGKFTGKSIKIIGLGMSSQSDPKAANDEARAAAFKDISLQLQSSVQSKSEIKESQSESSFQGNSILTSNTEDLVGLKAVKNGKRAEEKITDCEVYEFNVQSAYDDQSSKLSVVQEKIDQLSELGGQKKWMDVIREYASIGPLIMENAFIIKRADLFKSFLGILGPGWNERFQKSMAQLKDLDVNARGNLAFIFVKDSSQNQFEASITEVSDRITNAGSRVIESASAISPGVIGIEVSLKTVGTPRKSKTRLGLTFNRKVSIVLTDLKTKIKLGASNGLSIVGSSMEGDLDEAMANSENQLIAAMTNAIKNSVPNLIRN